MPAISVGAPFVPGKRAWPECAQYNYSKGGHQLLLFFADPTPAEISAVKGGAPQFAASVGRSVLLFRFAFGSGIPWSDAPYEWHRVPVEGRDVPSADIESTKAALLSVVLVDARTGIVKAIRAVSLTPELTVELHAAIRSQAALPAAPSDAVVDAELAELRGEV